MLSAVVQKSLKAKTRVGFSHDFKKKVFLSQPGINRNIFFSLFVMSAVFVVVMSAVFGYLPKATNAASLTQFDAIYAFGDSLSDNGNGYQATLEEVPYGLTLFDYERASNGPIWVEDVASYLNLPLTDLAFGGATTGVKGYITLDGRSLPGLQVEIQDFIKGLPNKIADPNALYTIWAGTNDYLNGATSDTAAIENLSEAVKSLNEVGAKNILVANLPDLGKLPRTRNTQNATNLSALTEKHNFDLAQALANLSQTLGSNINIIPLDVYSIYNAIINEPEKFGFTNVTDPCYDQITSTICDNADQHLFADMIHPTAHVHEMLAEAAISALQAAPVP